MWRCPNCDREFVNENQHHFCGKSPETIEEYIELFDGEIRAVLEETDRVLRQALPDARRTIAWSMPTYRRKRNIIHFAAAKKHLGIYPGPAAIEHFADRLKLYRTSKGAIQFPYQGKIPYELIAEIAKWCDGNM